MALPGCDFQTTCPCLSDLTFLYIIVYCFMVQTFLLPSFISPLELSKLIPASSKCSRLKFSLKVYQVSSKKSGKYRIETDDRLATGSGKVHVREKNLHPSLSIGSTGSQIVTNRVTGLFLPEKQSSRRLSRRGVYIFLISCTQLSNE